MSEIPIKYTMFQMARMIKVSVKPHNGVLVSKDTTPCMYDYAKELLKGVENEKK